MIIQFTPTELLLKILNFCKIPRTSSEILMHLHYEQSPNHYQNRYLHTLVECGLLIKVPKRSIGDYIRHLQKEDRLAIKNRGSHFYIVHKDVEYKE